MSDESERNYLIPDDIYSFDYGAAHAYKYGPYRHPKKSIVRVWRQSTTVRKALKASYFEAQAAIANMING